MFDSFWILLLMTLALVMVIEGIMPFLSPTSWKNMMKKFSEMSEKSVRFMGLGAMLIGVGLMIGVHQIVVN